MQQQGNRPSQGNGPSGTIVAIGGYARTVESAPEGASAQAIGVDDARCATADELRLLAAHLDRVREKERADIARELHDDVGSTLTALKFELAFLRRAISADAAAMRCVERADILVASAMQVATRIGRDMRPGILDEGLIPALEWQVRSFAERMRIDCRFSASHEDIPLPPGPATTLFRIAQEALNNIAKHAQASAVTVRLTAAPGRVTLEVRDDGRGIATSDLAKAGHFGLRGMRERVAVHGGSVGIGAGEGGGTTISATLPLAGAARAETAGAARNTRQPRPVQRGLAMRRPQGEHAA